MVAEELVGNLPYYIVITLFFSYLIWSKFLKKDKLKIEDVNDILDIISIFTFLFISLIGLSLILIFQGIINMFINLQGIWQQSILLLTFYVILGIGLITRSRDKKVSPLYLRDAFVSILQLYFILILFFISLLPLIVFLHFSHMLMEIILLIELIFLLIVLCYAMVNRKPFEVSLTTIFSKNFILIIILCTPVFLVSNYFLMPKITYEEPITLDYYMSIPSHNPPSEYWTIYSRTSIPINVTSLSELVLINQIPVYYGRYNVETEGIAGNMFSLLVNTSNTRVPQYFVSSFEGIEKYEPKEDNNYGFTRIVLDKKKKFFILIFDKNDIKKHDVNKIILEGYVKKNMSELNFSYSDNHEDEINICYGDGCTITINITNNLECPVDYEGKQTLLDFDSSNVTNKSKCQFVNVISNYPLRKDLSPHVGDLYLLDECNGGDCSFNIREVNEENKSVDIFSMKLKIVDNDVVRLVRFNIQKQLTVNATFDIVC